MSAKRVKATPDSAVPQDVIAILESIIEERDRAMGKFGVQNHPDGTGGGAAAILRDQQRDLVDSQQAKGTSNWRDILMEEVREAFAETDLVALDKELCQVQQVCLVWREDLARRMLTKAVTVSARSLVNSLEAEVAAITPEEDIVDAEMRSIASRYTGQPALRSLVAGGRPGRRWMLDNIGHLMVVEGKDKLSELARLRRWVEGLPSTWWDQNSVMTDEEKAVHDVRVHEALEAQKAQKNGGELARSEYEGGWSAPF